MYKRILSVVLIFSVLSLSIIGRVGYITFSNNYQVGQTYNSYVLNIDNLFTNFYYSNGTKINNNKTKFVAIIRPNEKCIGELDLLFDNEKKQEIIDELSKGLPVIKAVPEYKPLKHIIIKEVKATQNNCNQLINKSSKGLLHYVPDKIGTFSVSYNVDAIGRLLPGDMGTFDYNNYNSKFGYKLTIDNKIQEITYNACESLDNGCAIVLDINNFNILSCVTKPDNSYLNKPFLQYNPGSIFKIVVALCAIENNVDIEYNCEGAIKVGDTEFSCQNDKKHGNQTLKDALAHSCNCYFVNLAQNLGYEKLLKTANELGFSEQTTIFDKWTVKNANLPNENDLKSKGELALFGFGQGKLTVSPLQMAYCIGIIANGGYKTPMSLVKAKIDDYGKEYQYPTNKPKRVVSETSCNKMIDYLSYVVTNGTGRQAQSLDKKSAGKTATAQTGQYELDKEILNTWFVGVYPNDKPKYAIVIMKENGTSGSFDCCPIFSTIVDNLPK